MLTEASLEAFNGQLTGTPTSAHISRVSKPSARNKSMSVRSQVPRHSINPSTPTNMTVDEDDFESFIVHHPVEEVVLGDLSKGRRKSSKASRLSHSNSLFEQSISASSTPKEVSSRRKASRALVANENTPPPAESPYRPGSLRAKSKFAGRLQSVQAKSALGSMSFNGWGDEKERQEKGRGNGLDSEWQDEPPMPVIGGAASQITHASQLSSLILPGSSQSTSGSSSQQAASQAIPTDSQAKSSRRRNRASVAADETPGPSPNPRARKNTRRSDGGAPRSRVSDGATEPASRRKSTGRRSTGAAAPSALPVAPATPQQAPQPRRIPATDRPVSRKPRRSSSGSTSSRRRSSGSGRSGRSSLGGSDKAARKRRRHTTCPADVARRVGILIEPARPASPSDDILLLRDSDWMGPARRAFVPYNLKLPQDESEEVEAGPSDTFGRSGATPLPEPSPFRWNIEDDDISNIADVPLPSPTISHVSRRSKSRSPMPSTAHFSPSPLRSPGEQQATPSRLSSRLTPTASAGHSMPRSFRAPPTPFAAAMPTSDTRAPSSARSSRVLEPEAQEEAGDDELDAALEDAPPTPQASERPMDVSIAVSSPPRTQWSDVFEQRHIGDDSLFGGVPRSEPEPTQYFDDQTEDFMDAGDYQAYDRDDSPSPGPIPAMYSSPFVRSAPMPEDDYGQNAMAADGDATISYVGEDETQDAINTPSDDDDSDNEVTSYSDGHVLTEPERSIEAEQSFEQNAFDEPGDEVEIEQDHEADAAAGVADLESATAAKPALSIDPCDNEAVSEQLSGDDEFSAPNYYPHHQEQGERGLEATEHDQSGLRSPVDASQSVIAGVPSMFPGSCVIRVVPVTVKVEPEEQVLTESSSQPEPIDWQQEDDDDEAAVDQSMALDSSPARPVARTPGPATPLRAVQSAQVATPTPSVSGSRQGTSQSIGSPASPSQHTQQRNEATAHEAQTPPCSTLQGADQGRKLTATDSAIELDPSTSEQANDTTAESSQARSLTGDTAQSTPEPRADTETPDVYQTSMPAHRSLAEELVGLVSSPATRMATPARTPRRPRMSKEILAPDDPEHQSVVEISSFDPRAAARAAALLKMNYDYVEFGIEGRGSSSDASHRRRASRSSRSIADLSHISLPEMLHEAELDFVDDRSSRMRSPALTESVQATPHVPGFFPKTPARTRIDFNDWSVGDWRDLERSYRRLRRRLAAQGGSVSDASRPIPTNKVIVHFLQKKGLAEEDLMGQWQMFVLELRVEALERKHQNRNAKAPVKATAEAKTAVVETTPVSTSTAASSAPSPGASLFGRLLGSLVTPRKPDATPKPKTRTVSVAPEAHARQPVAAANALPAPNNSFTSAIPTKSLLDHPLLRRASVFSSSKTDIVRDDTSVSNPLLKRASVFVDATPRTADLSSSAAPVDNPLLRRAPVFVQPSAATRPAEMAEVPSGKPVSILAGQVSEGSSQHAAAIAALFKDEETVLRKIRPRASDASLADASFGSSQGASSSRRSNPISIPRRSTYSARDEQPSVRDMARSFEASIEMEREEWEREEQTLSRRKSLNMERASVRR